MFLILPNQGIKVVILCGGRGTRLQEETAYRPKPMVEIGGKPILWHIMKIYAHYGFNEFALCLGYKGGMIKDYFLHYEMMNNDFTVELGMPGLLQFHSDHAERGWKVTLADSGLAAMTGARVKRIEKYITGSEFMLTYGDGVANIDINQLLEFHRSHGKIGTVTGVRPPSRFGELVVEGEMVAKFSEKPLVSQGYINGGFFVFDRRFFDYLTAEDGCVLEREPLERLAEEGELVMYPHPGYWQCMDTYRDLELLQKTWETGRAPWKVWDDGRPKVLAG